MIQETIFSIHHAFPNNQVDHLLCCYPILNSFEGNKTHWQYGSNETRSSLIVHGGSFAVNQTYQFKVNLSNIQNTTRSFSGQLLVQIDDDSAMELNIQ